jgi:hypothetical protein
MDSATSTIAALPGDHFDARDWLDRFTAAGGAYVFTRSGDLWFITEGMNTRALIAAMREIAGQADRRAAVRDMLARRKPMREVANANAATALCSYTEEQADELRIIVDDVRAVLFFTHQALYGYDLEQAAALRLLTVISDSIEMRLAKAFPDEIKQDGRLSL